MKQKRLIFLVFVLLLPNITDVGNTSTNKFNSDSSTEHFSKNILVSTSNSYPQHVEPTLTTGSNNQLFVGWKNAETPDGGGYSVSFSKSVNDGQNWTTPITMPSIHKTGTWYQSDPWLVYFNNTIYYSYLDYSSSSQVTLSKSTDSGNTWLTSQISQAKYFADKPVFVIGPNGTIYVTYDDVNSAQATNSGKLSVSTDNGKSVAFTTAFNSNGNIFPYPALSSNNTLFLSWTNYETGNYAGNIFYDHSTNGGLNFTSSQPLNLYSFIGTGYSTRNDKTTFSEAKFDSNNRLYVLWSQFENTSYMKAFLRYSDNYGRTWSNKIPIDQNSNTNQWEPDMAIDSNNNLHLAWLEESNNSFRPYYREFSFSGPNRTTMTMSPIIPIASAYTSGSFTRPGDYLTIRVDSNDVSHVVWTDGRNGSLDIYYAYLIKPNSNSSGALSSGFTILPVFAVIPFYIIIRKIKNKYH